METVKLKIKHTLGNILYIVCASFINPQICVCMCTSFHSGHYCTLRIGVGIVFLLQACIMLLSVFLPDCNYAIHKKCLEFTSFPCPGTSAAAPIGVC